MRVSHIHKHNDATRINAPRMNPAQHLLDPLSIHGPLPDHFFSTGSLSSSRSVTPARQQPAARCVLRIAATAGDATCGGGTFYITDHGARSFLPLAVLGNESGSTGQGEVRHLGAWYCVVARWDVLFR